MREMSTFSRAIIQRVWRAAEALALVVERGLLLFERGDFLLVLDQRVDAGDGGLDARQHHLFGELLVVEDHHFLDVAHAALQILAQRGNLANHDGRTGDGLEHAHLAALDALGDFHFALARQQRHGAHLAQVHAHRVVGLFQRSRRQVELDVFALFQLEVLVAVELGAVKQVDALGADGGDQVVEILGRRSHLIRQHFVDVAVGQIALFLAHFNQGVDVVIVLVIGFVLVLVFVIVFKLVVNRQNVPTLLGKADAAPVCAIDLRNGAWTVLSALKKDFHQEIQKPAPTDTAPCSTAKMRFQGGCSEEDHSASGFAWVAREPELMVGAEGRISSQRL